MHALFVWVLIAALAWVATSTRSWPRVLVILVAIAYLAAGQVTRWTGIENTLPEQATAPAGRAIVYFTTGHGERDPQSVDRLGYSAIASLLQERDFSVALLDFSRELRVPSDADLVIVAGPKIDFLDVEIDTMREYAVAGGRALFLIDPVADLKRYIAESGAVLFMIDPDKKSDNPELTRIAALLREWGVDVGSDIVVDVSGMGQFLGTDASVPVAASYPAHPITENFSVLTAYPVARSVTPASQPGASGTAHPLVETGARSWAETNVAQLTSIGEVSMEQAKGDRQGPITLAVAVSDKKDSGRRESRLVVVGDSDFVANYVGNIPGNVEFFLKAVTWLTQ